MAHSARAKCCAGFDPLTCEAVLSFVKVNQFCEIGYIIYIIHIIIHIVENIATEKLVTTYNINLYIIIIIYNNTVVITTIVIYTTVGILTTEQPNIWNISSYTRACGLYI